MRNLGRRIYVAGPSSAIDQIEEYMTRLRTAGWMITCDWTVEVRKAGNVASPDDPIVRRHAALADLKGVRDADVIWLVQPETSSTSTGAWVELGYALGLRGAEYRGAEYRDRPFIVVSGLSKKCIFADLADEKFDLHLSALTFLQATVSSE